MRGMKRGSVPVSEGLVGLGLGSGSGLGLGLVGLGLGLMVGMRVAVVKIFFNFLSTVD